jgi:hypothetical protein
VSDRTATGTTFQRATYLVESPAPAVARNVGFGIGLKPETAYSTYLIGLARFDGSVISNPYCPPAVLVCVNRPTDGGDEGVAPVQS